jgi:hypothetical protein
MPVCEKCQTPYDDWQHFCLNCGTYLKQGPPPLLRCPRCGSGLETEPAFDEALGSPGPDTPSYLPAVKSWTWLGVAVATLFALGAIFFWQHSRAPVQSQVAETVVHPPETVSRDSRGTTGTPAGKDRLQAEVARVLDNIREANLKKNILLFMETLSGVYPQLDKKREEVIRTWNKFDFIDMNYSVGKVQEVEPNKALAEVQWTTTSQNRATKNRHNTQFHYRIWLANELGQWKITKIEQVPQ